LRKSLTPQPLPTPTLGEGSRSCAKRHKSTLKMMLSIGQIGVPRGESHGQGVRLYAEIDNLAEFAADDPG
jgi:hypothetical protein